MTKVKGSKTSARHKARELVLQSLYAIDCGGDESLGAFERLTAESVLAERYQKFAEELSALTRRHIDWADAQIAGLAKNWKIERMNSIDKNIIRMAMVELKYLPDVPVKVVINEAIELAKTFSTEESASFVNGILDAFSKTLDS